MENKVYKYADPQVAKKNKNNNKRKNYLRFFLGNFLTVNKKSKGKSLALFCNL